MKNIKKFLLSVFAVAVAVSAFAFVACNDGGGQGDGADNAATIGIELVTVNARTTFELGESFTCAGLQVNATTSDGGKRPIFAEDCEMTAPDMSTRGIKSVEIKYGEFSASYDILVREIKDLHVDISDVAVDFLPNAEFSYDGIKVFAEYYDIAEREIVNGFTITVPDMTTMGEKTVTVQYLGKKYEYKIMVNVEMHVELAAAHMYESNGKVVFDVSGKIENYIGDKSDIGLDIQRISTDRRIAIPSAVVMSDNGEFTITGNLTDSYITSSGDYMIHLFVRRKSYDICDLATDIVDSLTVDGIAWSMKSEAYFKDNPMKFAVVRARSGGDEIFKHTLTNLSLCESDGKAYIEFTGTYSGSPLLGDFAAIYIDFETNPNEFGSGDWGVRARPDLEVVSIGNGAFVLRTCVSDLAVMSYNLHFGGESGDVNIVRDEQILTIGGKTYRLVCNGTNFWGGSGLHVRTAGDPSALMHVAAKKATCTEQGNSEYWTDGAKYYSDAEGTNEVDYDTLVIAAVGHAAATEWTTGEGKHWHECPICNTVLDEKVDHTPGEWIVDEATDSHSRYCAVCEKFAVEVTEHTFTWIVDTPATDDTDGVRHQECVCGVKRNEGTAIPALGKTIHHEASEATCTENGNIEYWEKGGKCYTDAAFKNEIDQADTVIPAFGHKFDKFVYESDKFYKICSNNAAHKVEIDVSGKNITVNGTTFTVNDCASEDIGIVYDALNEVFTVDIAALRFENDAKALVLNATANTSLNVTAATTLDSLTFTSDNGRSLYIRGSAKLTISGAVDTGSDPLVIECDTDILSTVSSVNDLTIGNAENSVQPTVAIMSVANGEGINSSETADLTLRVLSGKLTIAQSGSGNCGISLHRQGDTVTVGEHGTLEIKGFGVAIVNWKVMSVVTVSGVLSANGSDGSGALNKLNFNITGTVTVTSSTYAFNDCTVAVTDGGSLTASGSNAFFGCTITVNNGVLNADGKSDAIKNTHLTIGDNGNVTVKGEKGIGGDPGKGSVKINGENAVLRVTTTVWGTENVGVTFIKGEAHFTLEGDGVPGFDMAAFSGSTNLDISAGFKLYVTHYHKIVNFFGNPCKIGRAHV